MRRAGDVLKGLIALAFTVGLVAGIPSLLVTLVGWPLPTEIPSWETIERTITTTGIDETLVVKTLAIVVWVTWAQLVWAITVETAAAIRGKVARRTATLPGIQAAAARLVATVSLIVSSFGPVRPAIATPLPVIDSPPTTAAVLVIDDPATPQSIASVVADEEAASVVDGPTFRVASIRQSYWSIAQETTGDPHRWTEIRDLNVGRTMTDGTVLTAGHEDLQPGWRLALPADAVLPIEAYEESQVTVEKGDNQWKLAEEHLEDVLDRDVTDAEVAPYWRDMVDENRDNIRSGDPDLIYPGEVLDLPAPAESLTDWEAPAAAGNDEAAASEDAAVDDAIDAMDQILAPADTSQDATSSAEADSVGEVADSEAATWVEEEVDAIDQDWLASGPEGELIVESDATIPGDIQMWVTEEVPSVAAIDATDGDPYGLPAGTTTAVVTAAGGAAAAGWWWRRRRRLEAVDAPTEEPTDLPHDPLEGDRAVPLPTELADDRGLWAVGAALGGLRGTPPTPAAVVVSDQLTRVVVPGAGDRTPRGWTLSERLTDVWEVPTSAISDRYVADAAATVPGLVRVGRSSEDEMLWVNLEAAGVVAIDGATPHITPLLELIATRLVSRPELTVLWIGDAAPAGCQTIDTAAAIDYLNQKPKPGTTALVARRHGAIEPLTVVLAASVPAMQRPALMAAVQAFGPDRGVAAITSWPTHDAAPEFSWTLTGYGTLYIEAMASHVTVDGLAEPPAAAVEIEPRPAPDVELQVLGRPRLLIDGAEVPLRRSQSIQLLAYLVTNPKGASTDKLLDVLWPDAPNQRAKKPTLQQCATELRRLVGIELLPRARDGWYRTGVTSDEQRFVAHVADADAAGTDEERAAHLRQALDLVREAPFDGVDWLWVMTDGLVTNSMQRIHDVAHQLAQIEVDLGRYSDADDSAGQGIATDSHCSRCWDLRIQAAAAAGNESHRRHLEEQRHRIAQAS